MGRSVTTPARIRPLTNLALSFGIVCEAVAFIRAGLSYS